MQKAFAILSFAGGVLLTGCYTTGIGKHSEPSPETVETIPAPPSRDVNPEWIGLLRHYRDAKLGIVESESAQIFDRPSGEPSADMVLMQGDSVAVYAEEQGFLAVATPEHGYLGYVESHALRLTFISAEYAFKTDRTIFASRAPVQPLGYKDPTTALVLSLFIPGAGHIYAGESNTGALLLVAGPVGVGVGLAATMSSVDVDCNGSSCSDNTNYAPMVLGYGVALAAWVYSVADGQAAAARANDRNGYFSVDTRPEVFIQNGAVRPGLRMSIQF